MNKLAPVQLAATIPDELAGKRLDQALAQLFPEHSRSRLQQWLKDNQITIDGKCLKAKDKVWGGEQIAINAALPSAELPWQAQAIALDITYEDEALLVINKPAGIVVHPAAGNWEGTLVNALLHHIPELANLPRAGLIHRLDKDTSGLLVIAKTLTAHTALTKQLQARTVKREYAALVCGQIIAGGTIDAPIGRHSRQRKQMAVIETGKPAVTHYRVEERFRAHTLLKVNLETGRTHQIRVHMASIFHPVFGDMTYGGRLQLPKGASEELAAALRHFKRQALHARSLGLIHPVNNEYIEWTSSLPDDFLQLVTLLRKDLHHAQRHQT